jgi:hypothetical protein
MRGLIGPPRPSGEAPLSGAWRAGQTQRHHLGDARGARAKYSPLTLDRQERRSSSLTPEQKQDFARAIFDASGPPTGPVRLYLAKHGVVLADDIRESLSAPLGYARGCGGPVVVAGVRDVEGQIIGVQVLRLRPDGGVIWPPINLGKTAGGAVRLLPAFRPVVLTQSLSCALTTISQRGFAAWATLSAAGMVAVELPADLRKVVIVAEGSLGVESARALGQRLRAEGRDVRVVSARVQQ